MSSLRTFRLLAASALVASVCSSKAADFKFGAHTLTVPDGFEIELVAGPPQVERPVSADFDERGNLYVTDSSGSNDKVQQQLEEKPHRVLRLQDTTGNGKFDQVTVFADHLMFPEGAMWRDGSLYVSGAPSIWKFTATDKAVAREEWFQGKTLTGCANDLHGPYAGPDGWIYWCKGAFAKQTYERPGKPPFVTRAAHIFRCRADGSGIEPVMTGGMDNPVGVAFTATGERILSGTFFQNPEGGKRDGLIHAIYGGVYGKVNDVLDNHPRTGELMPIMTHLGPAAPCGMAVYRSEIFGTQYQDNLFTCCFNLRKVVRSVLVPDGATFKTVESDFVTSDDPDFHPTCVLEDADGSLVVLNTGGWYKICCPTSQLAKPDVLGAIYRIRRQGAPKVNDPRGLAIKWTSLSPNALVQYLADPRPAVRDRAIDQLAKRGNPAVSPLSRALRKKVVSPEARRNAAWALTRIDTPSARKAVRIALADQDNSVRHVAALSCSLWRDAGAFEPLVHLLANEDAQVRRSAAEALGRIGNKNAVGPILNAAGQVGSDRILEHSLIYALMEIGDRDATALGLKSENARTHRAALIALDQMPDGKLDVKNVAPLLVSQDSILKTTANWIVGHHPDWAGALADFLRTQLALTDLGGAEAASLENQLASFASDKSIQELVAQTLATGPKPSQKIVLHAMAGANLKPLPASWTHQLAQSLQITDAELLAESITTARAVGVTKASAMELNQALLRIGTNENFDAATRLSALAAAAPLEKPSPENFDFLVKNIDASKPWAIRNNAALVLSRAALDRAQLLQLAAALRDVGPMELMKLLNAFDASADDAVRLAVVEGLMSAKSVRSLRADQLEPKFTKYSGPARAKADELLKMLSADAAKQKEHLDQLLAQLPPGDVRRGQAIFNGPKAACSTCHAIGYLGGHVGPDLTSIGTIRTQRDLLESIVYPSASFVRSFEPMIVTTKSGEDYTGILRKDAADEVVLVSGPQTEVRIPRSEMVEMRQGTLSIMPQGFDELLTKQELADLLAFLKNTKWGAK